MKGHASGEMPFAAGEMARGSTTWRRGGRGWKKRKFFIFMRGGENCQNICCETSCGAAGSAGPFVVVSANMPPDRIGHRKQDEGTHPTTPNRTELINLFSLSRARALDRYIITIRYRSTGLLGECNQCKTILRLYELFVKKRSIVFLAFPLERSRHNNLYVVVSDRLC